jgi:FkbM family methyltransferase
MSGHPESASTASGSPLRQLPERVRHPGSLLSADILRKLRPAKIRNALRRRRFEWSLDRLRLAPVPGLVDLGSDYGGWTLPGALIGDGWTCYSAGAGGDVSFDLELIHRFNANVRSIEPVDEFVRSAAEDAAGEPRFTAVHAAVATNDGPLRMQLSHDARSHSVSSAELYESSNYVEMPGRTLPSLMQELGDIEIQLLKLDLEGAEYEVLPTLRLNELGVKVLAVQLHHAGSLRQARALLATLHREGYEPVACRAPVKLTFARSDLL